MNYSKNLANIASVTTDILHFGNSVVFNFPNSLEDCWTHDAVLQLENLFALIKLDWMCSVKYNSIESTDIFRVHIIKLNLIIKTPNR